MKNTVCFFEIPSDNFDELQKFYGELFNWTFEQVPGQFRYYKINMGVDFPKGGMTARQDAEHYPQNYVKVDSVDHAIGKALNLGAKVLVPKKPVPGTGWFSVLLDPQGNRIGLWEEDRNAS